LCHNRAILSYLSPDGRQKVWPTLFADHNQERKLLRPWIKFIEPEKTRRKEIRTLDDAWVGSFGDPNDPEVQERIARTVAFLKRPPD
jgi:hypothetical protein